VKPEDLVCDDLLRRRELRDAGNVSGLDSVEVFQRSAAESPSLVVTFIGAAPKQLTPEHFVIEGRTARIPRVSGVRRGETRGGDDRVLLALDGEHDHSIYTLRLVVPEPRDEKRKAPRAQGIIDPRYDRVQFSFDLDCPRVDCVHNGCGDGSGTDTTPARRDPPEIDYLAKDYGSFRRLILDRLSLLLPEWKERHEADLGIMLVELLAYVGDQLSYQQDAVATEAYIGTARQRISLRRHARLVDYRLHEGCNARVFVHVALEGAAHHAIPWGDVSFATGGSRDAARSQGQGEVFHPIPLGSGEQLVVRQKLNHVSIYTWREAECCLPRGATSATLELEDGLLQCGDLLLFEEVLGPRTGEPSDADPDHRHVVRLTRVAQVTDPLHPRRHLVEVGWKVEDALPFPLCLSTITAPSRTKPPGCKPLSGVTVARGNVFLADHGRWEKPQELGTVPIADVPDRCDGPGHLADEERAPGRFRPRLRASASVTFRAPLPADDPCLSEAEAIPSAAALLRQDPRLALPVIDVREVVDGKSPWDDPARQWSPRGDLLESGPADHHFVAEIDNHGTAWLRFGDDVLGAQPAACTQMVARSRVGNGPAGNVGRDVITRVVVAEPTKPEQDSVRLVARNPLPARGGTTQESMEQARELVATPLRRELLRAITAEDYETIIEREILGLQSASADLLWNGSWYEAHVALDPAGRDGVDDVILCRTKRVLERVRRIGHDVSVSAAQTVPLRIALRVCARRSYVRAHVQTAVVRALGNGVQPDGTLGFFHPDNLTFGEAVRLSRIVARVGAIEGVASVRVERFERLFMGDQGELEQGYISLGRSEIARLDNDPTRPERGILDVKVEGGR
jgi:hypothetical protein